MVRKTRLSLHLGKGLCKAARTALAQNKRTGVSKIKAGLTPPFRNALKPDLSSLQKDVTLTFQATATQISQDGHLGRHLPALAGASSY